jgi:hypothetical protein
MCKKMKARCFLRTFRSLIFQARERDASRVIAKISVLSLSATKKGPKKALRADTHAARVSASRQTADPRCGALHPFGFE